MESLLLGGLTNAVWAAVLALAAAVAGRVWRHRPALVHGLWLLVLLKLATPSVVRYTIPSKVDDLPRPAPVVLSSPSVPRTLSSSAAAQSLSRPPAVASGAPMHAEPVPTLGPRWRWPSVLAALWLAGAVVWWLVVAWTAIRVHRLLRVAQPAPTDLRAHASRIASRLGLRRGPEVALIPASLPPMLWALVGRPRLLLPEALWGRLDDSQRDAVLAHELAHLKRRDHWVRRLEAAVLGFYWWYPVAWWARREVERAEEECCDAWVVWALPGSAHAYAQALVATAVFLSGSRRALPAGASGAGRTLPLQRRLSMILSDDPNRSVMRIGPRMLLLTGMLLLPLLPAPGQGEAAEKPPVAVAQQNDPPPSAKPNAPAPREKGAPKKAGPTTQVEVRISQPIVREVAEYFDFTGHIEAARTVELRSRTSGPVIRTRVRNGSMVKKGDVLFELDARTQKKALAKAEAELGRASARLKNADIELEATKKLNTNRVVSKDQVAIQESKHDEVAAEVKIAQAGCDLARLELEFTQVTAPFDGQIDRPLGEGNVVSADRTVLGTLRSLDPVNVGFDVDERTALRLNRLTRDGIIPGEGALAIRVALADEDDFPHVGKVESMDARISPGTGTVRCQAVFSNADRLFLPGMFARVRLETGVHSKAMLVAEKAFYSADAGYCVSVWTEMGAETRAVVVGLSYGKLWVVMEGLRGDEWIVVDRPQPPTGESRLKVKKVPMPE